MDNNLLAIGTRVQLTGIFNEQYGVIYSYSTLVTNPYLVKTDDGHKITCGTNDIQATIYTPNDLSVKDTSFTISAEEPKTKFEKGQIVFYQENAYTRHVVVISEVDAESAEYNVSYLDVEETTWVEEHELSEILDTSDCLDSAILKYQDLSKSLVELYASIGLLEKELHKQRSHKNIVSFLVSAAEQDVLMHARGLGHIEEE